MCVTSGFKLSALKGDPDSAAALNLQAVAQAGSRHNRLGRRQTRQAGQLVAEVELHHIVESGNCGDHLIHLRRAYMTISLCMPSPCKGCLLVLKSNPTARGASARFIQRLM